MNGAGRGRPGQLDAAAARPADAAGPADAGPRSATSSPGSPAPEAEPPSGRLRSAASRPVTRHLALLVVYLAAGIALTWPRASYLSRHLLPETRDFFATMLDA